MMWVRWTLPRLRIDQVMETCLKYLLPISCVLLLGVSLAFSEVLMGAEISWRLILASIGNIFWHLLNLLELYCLFKMIFKVLYNYGLFCLHHELGEEALEEWRRGTKVAKFLCVELVDKKKAGRRARSRPVPLVVLQDQDYMPVASRLRTRRND
jgi:hypothetical protein